MRSRLLAVWAEQHGRLPERVRAGWGHGYSVLDAGCPWICCRISTQRLSREAALRALLTRGSSRGSLILPVPEPRPRINFHAVTPQYSMGYTHLGLRVLAFQHSFKLSQHWLCPPLSPVPGPLSWAPLDGSSSIWVSGWS